MLGARGCFLQTWVDAENSPQGLRVTDLDRVNEVMFGYNSMDGYVNDEDRCATIA